MPFNRNHRKLLLEYRRLGVSLSTYQKAVDGSLWGYARKRDRRIRQFWIAVEKTKAGAWFMKNMK